MGELREYVDPQPLVIRADLERREIDVRLFAWDVPADVGGGSLEQFSKGARIHSAGVDVDQALIVARADHQDPPFGKVSRVWSQDDGPYATLLASRTRAGDDALQLATDGIYKGPSVGFVPTEPDAWATHVDGRPIAIRNELDLREVSLTWRPAHQSAAVIAVRATEGNGMDQAQTPIEAPAGSAQLPEGDLQQLVARMESIIGAKFDELAERQRKSSVDVPAPDGLAKAKGLTGRWVKAALMTLDGDRVSDAERLALRQLYLDPSELATRAAADVVTADNLGVVPKNVRSELLGIIDPSRPFLESTRQVDAGDSGVTQTFPRITQRPSTAVQAAEKDELASQKTIIGTVDFGMTTIGGYGDLSLQLIKRSSPSFLQLWLDLLAEQYAIDADDKGVDTLLAAGVLAGTGAFDAETFKWGEAFTNAAAASPSLQLRPDRMWLSTAAFVAMIDARVPAGGGGTPMYPGLVQLDGVTSTNQGGGPYPLRIRPVLVPALDDEAVDVIIGPSRGFAWAEDGTYSLQADVPAKAGRDVGLAGMIWYMPVYPAAFTTYALAP